MQNYIGVLDEKAFHGFVFGAAKGNIKLKHEVEETRLLKFSLEHRPHFYNQQKASAIGGREDPDTEQENKEGDPLIHDQE